MTWTDPTNWEGGSGMVALLLNNNLRNNLLQLRTHNSIEHDLGGVNISVTSTSFVDLGEPVVFLTTGQDLRISFFWTGERGSTDNQTRVDLQVDDDYYLSSLTATPNARGLYAVHSTANAHNEINEWSIILTDVPAGRHTFQLKWLTSGGTSTIELVQADAKLTIEEYGRLDR